MEKKQYFSSGEFARLTGINKRTLHYYNDIGLLRPKLIEENGYHYYSVYQFAELEWILTLRKIGLSLDEIHRYVSGHESNDFSEMLDQAKTQLEETLQQLLAVRSFLERKEKQIQIKREIVHGKIEICTLPEQKILLSAPIEGSPVETALNAARFSQRLKKCFYLYDNFGSCISVEAIQKRNFHQYDFFYAHCPDNSENYDEILPAGKYLRAFCVGDWEKMPEVYQLIEEYVKKHEIYLTGYAYEEGLNELWLEEEYVTMITIPCQQKDA